MNVIGISGWKASGKTTLITRLIPALRARGLSVSTIKHVHHSIDLDEPGKDTFAHREAGAIDVVMYSEQRWAILHETAAGEALDLGDMLHRLSPVDLVLAEGFKSVPMRRIEIRGDDAEPRIPDPSGHDTIALVTDGAIDPQLPTFRRDEIEPLADFVADYLDADTLRS